MRKTQKKQVEVMIELLEREQGAMKDAMNARDYASAINLLESCQQSAIRLGDKIEGAEGEGLATISLLEEYCEQIYQIYETIESGRNEDACKLQGDLQKLMENIKQSIAENIKIRFEIVFLPFKVSAWASMEKIWKAAKEDSDYDVYVIPIPYYYKTWSGSLREVCCEAEKFPKEVQITRYDMYDFEKHCPDIVVIHNPYDNYNPTTSVHPFFYSDNLKKYTEKLVYTPYFFLDELVQGDQAALENMNYYVTMPGVINADKVIVQSEMMRQTYIDFLTSKAGESTRETWEKKIGTLDLGKEVFVQEERKNIPQEWRDKVLKPDGSCKKLVLCSINISSLIEQGVKILEKLREVFVIIQEYKEAVTFVWYSGHVIKNNLKIMSPRLWEQYEILIQDFQKRGWGIYDDAKQEEELTELCDAYYGSGDAVTRFFYRYNKPVWLMNSEKDERTVIRELIKER